MSELKLETITILGLGEESNLNVVIGQSHFIKTIEDIHEALVNTVPGIKFGLAFCEASGPKLIRYSSTDSEMEKLAIENAKLIKAGHVFILFLKESYPLNVLNQIKTVPEVCRIFCATANPLQVVVAESDQGRGVVGVIDGESMDNVESEDEIKERHGFLRKIGYKK